MIDTRLMEGAITYYVDSGVYYKLSKIIKEVYIRWLASDDSTAFGYTTQRDKGEILVTYDNPHFRKLMGVEFTGREDD